LLDVSSGAVMIWSSFFMMSTSLGLSSVLTKSISSRVIRPSSLPASSTTGKLVKVHRLIATS
jgi:hypothetical protein